MPTAVLDRETARKETGPPEIRESDSGGKPDVKAIMSDVRRRAQREPMDDGVTERQYLASVRDRLNRPLGRGFSEDFAESMRTRDGVGWNVELRPESLRSSSSAFGRGVRWLMSPLFRMMVSADPVLRQVERQAEINEYYRRLLVAANKDLELARLEMDAMKQELRKLGVHVSFAFAESRNGSERGSTSGRGRGDSRRGGRSRSRGDGRRGDAESAGRREGARSRPSRNRSSRAG